MSRKTKTQKAYRRRCKRIYYLILFAYLYDFCNKFYLVTLPWLIKYHILPRHLIVCVTPIAITGVFIDFIAKWYMLKNMKMRKRGYYRRK